MCKQIALLQWKKLHIKVYSSGLSSPGSTQTLCYTVHEVQTLPLPVQELCSALAGQVLGYCKIPGIHGLIPIDTVVSLGPWGEG